MRFGVYNANLHDRSLTEAIEPGGKRPNRVENAWNSGALDVLDHQWTVAERFWREIDREAADLGVKVALESVAVVQDLGPLVFHAAAKDVRINPSAAVYGVLDNRFRRMGPDKQRTNLGGDEWANEWPLDAAWNFVAVGRGRGAVYRSTWLAALNAVNPDMLVNIEHEDTSLGRIERLEVASQLLLDAARRAGISPAPLDHDAARRSAAGSGAATAGAP